MEERWSQKYACKCVLGFGSKRSISRCCPIHRRDRVGDPQAIEPKSEPSGRSSESTNEATYSPRHSLLEPAPSLLSELRAVLDFRTQRMTPESQRFFASSPQVLRGVCPHGFDWSCHIVVGVLVPPTGMYLDEIQLNRVASVFLDYRMTMTEYANCVLSFLCKAGQTSGMRGIGLQSESAIVRLYGHGMGCKTCPDIHHIEKISFPGLPSTHRRKMQEALQLHSDPRMNECLAESLFQ